MITKEKILEILDKYAKDNFGINNIYIDNLEFEDLAEELVKNCSIPYVVGRSEQLQSFVSGFYEWHRQQNYLSVKREDWDEYIKTL